MYRDQFASLFYLVFLLIFTKDVYYAMPPITENYDTIFWKEGQTIANVHNKIRNRFANGDFGNPRIGDMSLMELDVNLSWEAQKFINMEDLINYENIKSQLPEGMVYFNLISTSLFPKVRNDLFGDLEGMINTWILEFMNPRSFCDKDVARCESVKQILYSKNNKIGCAKRQRSVNIVQYLCLYDKSFRFDDTSHLYQVGIPCSSCQEHQQLCYNQSLCASKDQCDKTEPKLTCLTRKVSEYHVATDKMTFEDADSYCRGKNMQLPKIENSYTNAYIYSLAKHYNIGDYWINANDKEREGIYVNSDNVKLTYTNWHPNQPDNWGNEDCIHVKIDANGRWNDLPCNLERNVICQPIYSEMNYDYRSVPYNLKITTTASSGSESNDPISCKKMKRLCYRPNIIKKCPNTCNVSYKPKITTIPSSENDPILCTKLKKFCDQPKILEKCPKTCFTEYHVALNKMNFQTADSYCKAKNMQLSKIENLFTNSYIYGLANYYYIGDYWINGNDKEKEGVYVNTDNVKLTYTNWHPNQPDNYYNEDCVHVKVNANGQWNDLPCNYELDVICQPVEKKSPIEPPDCQHLKSLCHNVKVSNLCLLTCQNTNLEPVISQEPSKFTNVLRKREYYASKERMTLEESVRYCKRRSVELINIKNSETNKYIHLMAMRIDLGTFWINGNDKEKEGIFVDKDNNHLIYRNLATNQLNKSTNNCINVQFDTGVTGTNINCNDKYSTVCEYEQMEYHIGKEKMTFDSAVAYCKNQSMQLVKIENEEINKIFNDLAEQERLDWFWINGNDQAKEGTFVDSEYNLLEYTNWRSHQPDNRNNDEHCIHSLPELNGVWNDGYCTTKLAVICQPLKRNYHIGKEKMEFDSAAAYCKNQSMQLVKIENAEENKIVNDLAEQEKLNWFWINGNDRVKEGIFVDTEDNPLQYTNWLSQQSDNRSNDENCIHSMPELNGVWNNINCTNKYSVICQPLKKIPPITTPECSQNQSYCTNGTLSPMCNNKCDPAAKNKSSKIITESTKMEYYMSNEKMTFQESVKYCKRRVMELVRIRNEETNNYLNNITMSINLREFWINGNDREKEGVFVDTDNKPLTYSNWDIKQPNNRNKNEHCIKVLNSYKAIWNDVNCDEKYPTICEYERSNGYVGSNI